MWQRGGVNISAEIPNQDLTDQTGLDDVTENEHHSNDGHQPASEEYASQPTSETPGTSLTGSSTALEDRTGLGVRNRAVETHEQDS
jgi:hypothetical protein